MELTAKQKIVLAVIECIEKEGINAVTIRSVAREAGVNSAAINYYFGSKEKLIDEAFEYIQKDFMMDFVEIINKDDDLRVIVEELLLYVLQGTIRYPNIVRAVLYEPFINNNNNGIFIDKLNALCQELYNKIDRGHGTYDEKKNIVSIVQLVASSLLMGLFPGFFKEFSDMDLKNEETMKDYIKKLADIFVNVITSV